jgi:hypothetical protein
MAKGFGIEVSDLLVAGAVAFVAYSAYKTVIAPVSKVTNTVADAVDTLDDIDVAVNQRSVTSYILGFPQRWAAWMTGKGVLW